MLNEPVCNALYTADYILTQNAGRDVIRNGAVAVAGDRICCVGHTDMLEILYPEARRVDLGCAVILPGLINSHTHVSMSLLRGYSDDKALMDWLQQDIFPREAKLTPELVELGALFSFAEMLRTGTTAFFDMYMLSESVVRAADRIGMRGLIGESVTQYFPSLAADSFERYCDVVRGLADRLRGHKRLRAAVLPHAPYTTTPQMLRDCHALARELDLPFGMHLAETQTEVQGCREAHGLSPVAYCRSLGLLQPNSTFFHTVYADEEDIQMLAEGGCAVVHNPASNMKLASGHAPVEAMRRAAGNAHVTFHRAFDRTADPFAALEDIISLGCNRILTSGQQPKAIDGTPLLAKLQEKAAGRITLLAGSGVNEDNIRDIYDATGISEYHFSARVGIKSKMKNICQNVYMGAKDADEQNILVTDKDRVRNTIDMLTK